MGENLKKELNLLDVFCLATGAMISSGLFVLPGLAFAQAGPAVILSYLVAGLLCVPTLVSSAELITAMPKAGGDYFYFMRGWGPFLGTVAGFSTWFSLSLKGAFALLGIGAYLGVVLNMPNNVVALIFGLFFILLNIAGAKKAGSLQVVLVVGLVGLILTYIIMGFRLINPEHYTPFLAKGLNPLFGTASFVFISYGGLTKIAALAEEVKNPGRNLPLGMILSIGGTSLLYALAIFVTIGVLNPADLGQTLTPISDGAGIIGGSTLKIALGIGALLAFITTANSGIMTASRYPLGMSRDKLLPGLFQKLTPRTGTPWIAILATGTFMVLAILFLPLELLVKIASSVLLLLFLFANITLILFRESKISSYKPKFRSPLYPYMQIVGIIGGLFLLVEMGTYILFLTMIFLLLGAGWYKLYAQKRAAQDSALLYALEQLTAKDEDLASENLLTELKDIVIQRDNLKQDQFYRLIENADVLDIEEPLTMANFFSDLGSRFGKDLGAEPQEIARMFIDRERESSTVVEKGLAIPHIILEGVDPIKAILVRATAGIIFPGDELVHILFVLVGSPGNRMVHLQLLAAIAQITQHPDFSEKWFQAEDEKDLKYLILLADRNKKN